MLEGGHYVQDASERVFTVAAKTQLHHNSKKVLYLKMIIMLHLIDLLQLIHMSVVMNGECVWCVKKNTPPVPSVLLPCSLFLFHTSPHDFFFILLPGRCKDLRSVKAVG